MWYRSSHCSHRACRFVSGYLCRFPELARSAIHYVCAAAFFLGRTAHISFHSASHPTTRLYTGSRSHPSSTATAPAAQPTSSQLRRSRQPLSHSLQHARKPRKRLNNLLHGTPPNPTSPTPTPPTSGCGSTKYGECNCQPKVAIALVMTVCWESDLMWPYPHRRRLSHPFHHSVSNTALRVTLELEPPDVTVGMTINKR